MEVRRRACTLLQPLARARTATQSPAQSAALGRSAERRLPHASFSSSARARAQQRQQPHPLARNPNEVLRRPAPGQSARTAPPPRRLGTLSVILLATFTGATTYAIGLQSSGAGATQAVKPRDPTPADFAAAIADLKQVLPEDCFEFDRDTLLAHSHSDWSYHDAHALPGVVLYPRSTEDVVAIVKAASKHALPVVPYSGGTSLEGHFAAPAFSSNPNESVANEKKQRGERVEPDDLVPGLALSLDFSENMNNIVAIDEKDLDVRVQPGVGYEVLNQELKDQGIPLMFPVDPGPGAMIGGMIGTGCSGTNAVRYGTMRENVINLTVVLPSGEIVKTRQRAKKSSVGPDLTRLFIGSEGTLGIVVEATLKLVPVLPYNVAVSSFPTIEDAASTARDLIQHGVGVACVELLDDLMMKAINLKNGPQAAYKWKETPTLFLKFSGTEGQIKSDIEQTKSIASKNNGSKLVFARNPKEADAIWYSRKVALWSALEYVPGSKCWTTDVCVPLGAFPALLRETKEEVASSGIVAPVVSHAGDGNCHFLLLFRDQKELEVVKKLVHNMVERAQRADGTATGEHGVGEGKKAYLQAELGANTVELLRSIKKLVDPQNIMNPGKLLPEPGESH